MAGVSAASANQMRQPLNANKMPPATTQHNIYAGHNNSKGQQHAAFTVTRGVASPRVDID